LLTRTHIFIMSAAKSSSERTDETSLRFRHERIDAAAPSDRLGVCLTTDLTGNGLPDVVVGAYGPRENLFVGGTKTTLPSKAGLLRKFGLQDPTLYWYENTGTDWIRHSMADVPYIDVGGALGDVNGDGRMDVIVGQGLHHTEVYWVEQPADPRDEWTPHLVCDEFEKYHDIEWLDVDDDGEPELVGLSQQSETIFYYDVPEDPTVSPWPEANRTIVTDDLRCEGVTAVDIDGDGRTELLAGTSVFHREDDRSWTRESVLDDWDDVRLAVGDFDDDGDLEIVYAEGDSPTHGTHMGRVAVVDGLGGEVTVLAEDLFNPHSLQVADFDGDGRPDIYVAEMGLGENADPKHLVFTSDGDGSFDRHLVAHGIATHQAQAVDVNGDGRIDVVGKDYSDGSHVDVWYNESA
jgi:hypothetical protein